MVRSHEAEHRSVEINKNNLDKKLKIFSTHWQEISHIISMHIAIYYNDSGY